MLSAFAVILTAACAASAHEVQVRDAATGKQVITDGGRLLADYGSYQLYEAAQVRTGLVQSGAVELRDDSHLIQLNAATIDTSTASPETARQQVSSIPGKRMRLIQFVGPIKPEWREALKQTGAQIVSYIPQNAYLVYGNAAALTKLQSLATTSAFVRWHGEYRDDYKIHPAARLVDAQGKPRRPFTDMFAIQLLQDAEANPATLALIDRLKLEPVRRQYRILHYVNVFVRLRPEDLTTLAAQPDVVSIQPYGEPRKFDERQDQIVAGNLTGNVPTGPGYLAWLTNLGFTQTQFDESGFVVDISDSGIDNGTTSPGHFALYELGDTNNPSRVAYNRLEGTPDRQSTIAGCDGHGNLNAHIVCAYDDQPAGFPHTDSAGYYYDLGVCPFVRVGSSVIFDPSNFTNPDYADLMSDAYNDGARISNNSWGDSGMDGEYGSDSQAYDALVRDAQPDGSDFATAGNQEMVIVFVDSNDGPGSSTISPPATAKNVISVGGSENVRSMSTANGGNNAAGYDGCDSPDSQANNANDIVSFSGRGPCSDGRKKPDIVAPAIHITAGAPQSSPPPSPSGTGSALSCFLNIGFDQIGVCGVEGGGSVAADDFFPVGQEFFTESTGTSHAGPAVCGACALVRQYFINHSLTPPSPAMTKAYLMNSARYMTGSGARDTLWSNSQGMGELDLGMAFDGVGRILRDEVPADEFTASGQVRTYYGTTTDPTKPFRVTLAWTDVPASTASGGINNDLDLTVSIGCDTFRGNVFSGDQSVAGGAADHKNNVESVYLPAGTTGDFTITVTADNINSDALNTGGVNQDFALVVYNAQTITNQPVECSFIVNATTVNLGAAGAKSKSVTVKACNSGCAWTAVSNDPFITILSGTNGTGSGSVHFAVAGNTNIVPLTGTMTVAGQTITINQAAGGCTNKLSPASAKFSATGGARTVKVKAKYADCAWSAVSNDSFITITGGTNGIGNGAVSYSVAPNTNTVPLSGTMTIAGQTFTVTESAAP
ncbi:MAG TPA: S8 family serine peptidase [Verrucomicrobiae bacterium]|nr:S8 family serine peptidase [Verrucomicrobiae bacterium]